MFFCGIFKTLNMEKFTKSFGFLFLITNLWVISLFAHSSFNTDPIKSRSDRIYHHATYLPFFSTTSVNYGNNIKSPGTTEVHLSAFASPPTVSSPIYYCQGSPAVQLTATPSAGGTLNWYGTNAVGGVASAVAPTPSTAAVGSTSYYVSETIGAVESARVAIVVNVVANNGATILNFRCDPTQATTATSAFFDWANNPLISNSYNYSYTIQGGPVVTGSTGVSHVEVFGVLPGQSATLTLSSATHPCVPPLTITCSAPCGASTVTPNFAAIPAFCAGTVAPVLGATSPNGITGTWAPALISNTTSGNYVFTPDPILFPCATTQTMSVTVTPLIAPTFTAIPTTVCQNAPAPVLPVSSTNAPSIVGTWNPATVDTSTLGTTIYTFTPTPGQCASAALTTASITVVPVVSPNFANIPALCFGTVGPVLMNTSPNGIVGTWSPAAISNTVNGSYVFTPNANQCATTQTLNVTILPRVIPNFPAIPSFCSGTVAPLLTATSPNGITGTWSPSTISNTASGNYVFTPNATECATGQTLNVTVNPLIQPTFVDLSICSGTVPPILATTSPNGITGTWLPSTIDNTTSGTYVFTPNAPQCAASKTINVTVNPSNTLVSAFATVSEAFADNQVVTISAAAAGNYLYQLDGGAFQSSPIFENVTYGPHTATVKDANGCSLPITVGNILVVNYPKFFTPNGDSYNDSWNIFSLVGQTDSRIRIFDRYGKFLKEISPLDPGWDGTYNGHPLPATDYWFVVEYAEQNVSKKFKSHFSLKR